MPKYIDADRLKHYVLNSDALLMPQTERAKVARLLDAAPAADVAEVEQGRAAFPDPASASGPQRLREIPMACARYGGVCYGRMLVPQENKGA